MDQLLHAGPSDHPPDRRGRLSTVGHAEALRAFARAARKARVEFMVIGGTFRDVAVRASTTRDIDVVLASSEGLDEDIMIEAGFSRVSGARHAWRYRARGGRFVDLEIAALASTDRSSGPFSVAFAHARKKRIEGTMVAVPTIEDFVILKLLAAADDARRRNRDLLDVQDAIAAYPHLGRTTLSVAGVRARLRDLYAIRGERLKDLVALLRLVPRTSASSAKDGT